MRYMLNFTKEGDLKYLSHLDLIRMFKRAFRRSEVALVHSAGFNPHPKMTLALPLSLGYTSVSEWMEIETVMDWEEEALAQRLGCQLPEGMRLLSTQKMDENEKKLASRVKSSEYLIKIPLVDMVLQDELVHAFSEWHRSSLMDEETIPVSKKTKRKTEHIIDIRPMIIWMYVDIIDNNILLSTLLAAGSEANLSPELLLQAFQKHHHLDIPRETIEIMRTDLEM